MKKYLLSFLILLLAGTSFSQKVKIKDGIATVDGVAYLKITKMAMGTDLSIMGMNSTDVEISALYLDYKDPNNISTGNPEGKVRWIEVNFLTLGIKCEVDSRTNKGFVKLLYLSKIYIDNELHQENAKKFVSKYGTKFSENRPKGTTIIINN